MITLFRAIVITTIRNEFVFFSRVYYRPSNDTKMVDEIEKTARSLTNSSETFSSLPNIHVFGCIFTWSIKPASRMLSVFAHS